MKLTLTHVEKRRLAELGSIQINRKCYIPAAASSIVHGIGNKSMFDKIAYKWIYGDTDDYIEKMKSVGRRGTEYIYGKTKDRNIVNGGCWYDFNKVIDEFGEIAKKITAGRKNKLSYKISSFTVSLIPKDNTEYLDIVLNLNIVLIS